MQLKAFCAPCWAQDLCVQYEQADQECKIVSVAMALFDYKVREKLPQDLPGLKWDLPQWAVDATTAKGGGKGKAGKGKKGGDGTGGTIGKDAAFGGNDGNDGNDGPAAIQPGTSSASASNTGQADTDTAPATHRWQRWQRWQRRSAEGLWLGKFAEITRTVEAMQLQLGEVEAKLATLEHKLDVLVLIRNRPA